jgi:5-methylthioadenosine/S-adenosylhomocysteine deaminase
MVDLLIKACDVLRVEKGSVRIDTQQDIEILGDRISSIHPTKGTSLQNVKKVIKADGMLATPGFMNTHAHVSMVLFRGMVEDITLLSWFNDYIWPLESNLTPEDVYWGALLGIAEMIENGVTSVADHYFAMDEVARAVNEAGIRANLCWAVFGHEGISKLDKTSEFVKTWQHKGDGRITTWLGPHAPYTTGYQFLKLVAVRAKELSVGIHTHVSETKEQVDLSLKENGITPVQMLEDTGVFEVPTLLAHCRFPTENDLTLLAKKDTGIAISPKTYLKMGEPTVLLKPYIDAGIPLGLATDGAASSNSLDIIEQLRLMVLSQKEVAADPTFMTVADALYIAFQGSARVLRLSSDLGVLESGRFADLVLLRQDGVHIFPQHNLAANLIYSSRSSDVDTVICNGKILLQNGQLMTIDKKIVKREIDNRLKRLSERVPNKRIATYPA